jgi:hypothetical protein
MIEIQIIKDAFEIYGRQYSSLGDYSATSLIDAPRRVALHKRYGDTIKHTPESQAASIVGTGVHEKVERLLRAASVKEPDKYWVERQIAHPIVSEFPEVQTGEGLLSVRLPKRKTEIRLLAGKFDIYMPKDKILGDIKTCKVWKLKFDPDKKDWTQQLNIYAWLLAQRGHEVKKIKVIAFFLDWIEANSIRDREYPKEPIMELDIDMWPLNQTTDFINDRMKYHIECESLEDDQLPKCTKEEMWQRDPEFAIFKDDKAKRAAKVIREGELGDAITIAQTLKNIGMHSYIEIRHQSRKRCEKFCPINEYCSQWKAYKGKQMNEKFELGGVL